MTTPLQRPPRKNPLARTRQPLLPPGARSRTAHGLTAAAAEGHFALQVCAECETVIYPPREACPKCLSPRLPFRDVDPSGVLVSETTVRVSPEPYFRERVPWRVGLVKLDAGPMVVAHLHGDAREGARVRLTLQLDRSGAAVMLALPDKDTPNMADDPILREMTCDPKFRRVLITDGRGAVGQAMAKACADAGASIVFVGVADPWKPFAGEDALKAIAPVTIVPLDLTDSDSVLELAAQDAGRVDIVINTAEHVRPGGILDGQTLIRAREAMELRYLGLMRLAQAFGPALRARGADGVNSAAALRQYNVRARAGELAGLWRLLGGGGGLPLGVADAARRAPARRRQGDQRFCRSARDRMVPERAAAQGGAVGAGPRGGRCAQARPGRRLCRRRG